MRGEGGSRVATEVTIHGVRCGVVRVAKTEIRSCGKSVVAWEGAKVLIRVVARAHAELALLF